MFPSTKQKARCGSRHTGTQGGYDWHLAHDEEPCRACVKGRKEWRKATGVIERVKQGRFRKMYVGLTSHAAFAKPTEYEAYPSDCVDGCSYIYSCDGKGDCWCESDKCDERWREHDADDPCPRCRYAWACRIQKTFLREKARRRMIARIPLIRQLLPDAPVCGYYAGTARGLGAHRARGKNRKPCAYCDPIKHISELTRKAAVIRLLGG